MKISIVTPTLPNRRDWLTHAAYCLKTQYVPDLKLEWIILDEYSPANGRPYKPSLPFPHRYEQLTTSSPIPTGQKRNSANVFATGDVIMHWDDDDWYHPFRIVDQINFLQESGKQVVGYHSLLYWRYADSKGFKYDDPTLRPNAAGTSLVYTRQFWEKYPFEDRAIAEDFFFCMRAKNQQQLASKAGTDFVVARVHGKNTCKPHFGSGKFPEVPKSKFPVSFLLTLPDASVNITHGM